MPWLAPRGPGFPCCAVILPEMHGHYRGARSAAGRTGNLGAAVRVAVPDACSHPDSVHVIDLPEPLAGCVDEVALVLQAQ